MMQKTRVALAIAQAVGVGSLIALAPTVMAQQADISGQPLPTERITVTGSLIKRTQTEGALPVLTLDRTYIEQSGYTSSVELIQNLPQVQNFVASSASVNGGGSGVATAALHALPSKYTLVLVDGQRMAPTALNNAFGGGFGANVANIPLDAVERVEILLDGATAIYGSDAIAGVVNFILKKNTTAFNAYGQYTQPQHSGGASANAGLSKGWGDLEKDGWNVNFSYSYAKQDSLAASQRDFSRSGAVFPFTANGTRYIFNQATSNTEPANITFNALPRNAPPGTDSAAYSLNPFFTKNGNCGSPLASALTDTAALGAIGVSCRFNYAATVQDVPSSETNSVIVKGYLKLGADATLWGLIGLSRFDMNAQYAPGAQPLSANSTTRFPSLYNAYVQPFLNANNLVNAASSGSQATIGYRAVSNGGRADDYVTDWQQYATGVDGRAGGWDYNARIVASSSKFTDTAAGGYTDFDCFNAAVASGAYDPILGSGTAAIKPCILGSEFTRSKSTLNSIRAGAQHDFFELPGGPTILALGTEYYQQKYTVTPSDLYKAQSGFSTQPPGTNFPIGGNYGQIPYDMSRDNWAAYGEWFFPILRNLEATASVRYDHYGKTRSKYVFDTVADPVTGLQNQLADADLGNTFSKTTGKIALRWLPIETLLLRTSYGTGFRAPAMTDIAGALVFNGSTQGSYACPFPGSPGCLPGSAQYDLLAGPNGLSGDAGLKPETSKQWTVGARWEPTRSLSFGADLWNVEIKNQVLSQGIAENLGFANPQLYKSLFVNPYNDPAGFTTIAFAQLPFNGGQANYRGVDWDVTYRTDTPWGRFNANWTGTQMLKAEYNFGSGFPYNSDLGKFGPDNQVVFRTTMQLLLALQTGPWLNTVATHYKSGYTDQPYDQGTSVFLAKADGSLGDSVAFCCLHVPSYTTWDIQSSYNINKNFKITGGIINLFDRDPPFTLQNAGGGNQIGYDGRYADPIGRQFYLRASVTF